MSDIIENPSFHSALAASLFNQKASVKVSILSGLHERGVLDLDTRDENGMTLLELMNDMQPLALEVVEFLDSINRSDVYSSAVDGVWHLMDRQLWWYFNKNTQNEDQAKSLARMIDSVDEQWWQQINIPGADSGAVIVAAISPLKHAPHPLEALWRRGVSPHARLPGPRFPLACSLMATPEALVGYVAAGGDLNAPEFKEERTQHAMWRSILSKNDNTLDVIEEFHKSGLIDQVDGGSDIYFKRVSLARSNGGDMIKKIIARSDWHQFLTYNGTPGWMEMVRQRGDLLDVFIERKRSRPDFTQRDNFDRSIWFVVASHGPIKADIAKKLEEVVPSEKHVRTSNGIGLAAQLIADVVDTGGGKKWAPLKNLLASMDENVVLDGIERLNFDSLVQSLTPVKATPFFDLLNTPSAVARMTPRQRGAVLVSVILNDKGLRVEFGTMWEQYMTRCIPELESLGLEWPPLDAARLKERYDLMDSQPRRSLARNLMGEWVSGAERQALADQTPIVKEPPAPKRRF